MRRRMILVKALCCASSVVVVAGCKSQSSTTVVRSVPPVAPLLPAPANAPSPPTEFSLGFSDFDESGISRPWLLTDARQRLGTLDRNMLTTVADAYIKGVAAMNAVTATDIRFQLLREQIESDIDLAQRWRGDGWDDLFEAIHAGIDEAGVLAYNARAAVNGAPALPLSDPVPWYYSSANR